MKNESIEEKLTRYETLLKTTVEFYETHPNEMSRMINRIKSELNPSKETEEEEYETRLRRSLGQYLNQCIKELTLITQTSYESNRQEVLYGDSYDIYAEQWAEGKDLPKDFVGTFKKRLRQHKKLTTG